MAPARHTDEPCQTKLHYSLEPRYILLTFCFFCWQARHATLARFTWARGRAKGVVADMLASPVSETTTLTER